MMTTLHLTGLLVSNGQVSSSVVGGKMGESGGDGDGVDGDIVWSFFWR